MMKETKGKVYLIGSGPGDPGLITVKGLETLHSCDVVVYDNLVPDEIIIRIPDAIEKVYVGKIGGKPSITQPEINEFLVKLARQNKKVARLKGADPIIFGRGGEEAKFLKENGVKFEIVPGVTAGIAGPAYAGIPCTDRFVASSVTFVTGHKAKDKEVSSVDWETLAKIKQGTIVVYMGVSQIENVVGKLTAGGMDPKTPAAIIERGTYSCPAMCCLNPAKTTRRNKTE